MESSQIKELQIKIEAYLSKAVSISEPQGLYEPIRYLMELKAKRLRPVLCMLSARMFGGIVEDAIPAAAAIELFHNFTLAHDDIMDNAPLRRGAQTLHNKWNDAQAILSGDALMVVAYRELEKLKPDVAMSVFGLFNKTALEVCEGQQLDMDFETRDNVSQEEYLEMIRLKTSVLLAASLKMGAIIGGASEKDQGLLYDCGIHLGLCFQLRDDYLDTFGSVSFGKRIGGDILADKKTYMLIRSQEKAQEKDREILTKYVGNGSGDEAEKVAEIKGVMTRLDIDRETESLAQKHFDLAMKDLDELSLPETTRQPLKEMAEALLSRLT